MSAILVVEQDAGHAEQIAEALRADGFQVEIAISIDAALRFAAKHTPRLVFASATLPHAKDLLGGFSRRRGGPGAVAIVPVNLASEVSPHDFQADELLPKPFSDEHLRSLVERCLNEDEDEGSAPQQPSPPTLPPPVVDGQQLTSADIFGDLLAEVEDDAKKPVAPAARRTPSPPSEDLERKLEETLSGVIDFGASRRQKKLAASPVGPSEPAAPPAPSRTAKASGRAASSSTSEVDDLLDKTLASLDLPLRQRMKTPPAAKAPAPAEADDRSATASSPAPSSVVPASPVSPSTVPSNAVSSSSPSPSPPSAPPEAMTSPPPPAAFAESSAPVDVEPEDLILEPPDLEPLPEPLIEVEDAAPSFEDESGAAETSSPPPSELSFAFDDEPDLPPEAVAESPRPETPASYEEPVLPEPEEPPQLDFDSDHFRTRRFPTIVDDEPASPEGAPFGDYTLLHRVAVGGMAEVWQARRRGVEGFQKTVAIKKILSHLTDSADFVTMFIDEAKLAAQLNHNNIIQIYDLGKVGRDYFIAMEYVDGKDLRSILKAGHEASRPLPVGLALMIAARLARALDYAHRKRDFDNRDLGLVHRDVSPQNVLISYEGEIKLCDFGIVKAVAKASTTQMGALKGKLQYMSPEQAWGKPVDSRSDIFSLGAVLFEMLAGRKLFAADSEVAVLDAVRDCRISPPSELNPAIPPEVDELLLRVLAKQPEARFQTAGEMEQGIELILHEIQPRPSEAELTVYMKELFAVEPHPAATVDDPSSSEQLSFADAELLPPSLEPAVMAEDPVSEREGTGDWGSWVADSEDDIVRRATGESAAAENAAAAGDTAENAAAAGDIAENAAAASDAAARAAGDRDKRRAALSTRAGAPESSYEPATSRGGKTLKIAVAVALVVLLALVLVVALRERAPGPSTDAASPATSASTAVSPEPEEPPVDEVATTEAGTTAAAGTAPPSDATGGESPEAEGAAGSTVPADLEEIVDQALSKKAEQLIQDLEAEKKRLQKELAKTRSSAPPAVEPPAAATEDSPESEPSSPPPPPSTELGGREDGLPSS